MWEKIKAGCRGFITGFLGKMGELIPGGWITAICLSFNSYALYSAGLLGIGAVSGIALCFSILFILLASAAKTRDKICRFIAYNGSKIDVVLTVLLTWYGFTVGPTMGMVALFLGLNISMFCSVIRWAYFFTRQEERLAFDNKENPKKIKAPAKRNTPLPNTELILVGA